MSRMARRLYRLDPEPAPTGYLDHGNSAQVENKWVFEIAWEVVNKGLFIYVVDLAKLNFSH